MKSVTTRSFLFNCKIKKNFNNCKMFTDFKYLLYKFFDSTKINDQPEVMLNFFMKINKYPTVP